MLATKGGLKNKENQEKAGKYRKGKGKISDGRKVEAER